MDMKIGTIVQSTAGKDKGRYFCIVQLTENRCFVRDGDMRKIENPKRKNIKHLKPTAHTVQSEALQVNKNLKKAIDSLTIF